LETGAGRKTGNFFAGAGRKTGNFSLDLDRQISLDQQISLLSVDEKSVRPSRV
jgi:hypothetical protein